MSDRSDAEIRWRKITMTAKVCALTGIVGGLAACDALTAISPPQSPDPYTPPAHVVERSEGTRAWMRQAYPTLMGEDDDD